MTLSSLLIFLPVYALAVLSPGPAVAAVVSRVLARGTQGMGAFILGLILGDLTWLLAAVCGLALVVQAYAALFRLVQYAGAAYLFYVAVMMWRAQPRAVAAPEHAAAGRGWSAFFAAYVLTLGNPKTMVFFLSIMPLLVRPDLLDAKAVAQLALICTFILAAVLSGYVVLALRARRLFTSSRAIRRLNRSTAALMGCTAVAVASR